MKNILLTKLYKTSKQIVTQNLETRCTRKRIHTNKKTTRYRLVQIMKQQRVKLKSKARCEKLVEMCNNQITGSWITETKDVIHNIEHLHMQ